MSENATTEVATPSTVQQFRHKAVGILKSARTAFSGHSYGSATSEAYSLLNGTIESILKGRQGLSQEAQVEHLRAARERAEENLSALPEVIEKVKVEFAEKFSDEARANALEQVKARYEEKVAQVNAIFDAGSPEALDGIVKVARPVLALLDEAAEFAANRDFDAHQQAKHEARNALAHDTDEDDTDEDDTDED